MSESRREAIIAGVGVNKKTRRAYIERWLSNGTLAVDPDEKPSKATKEPGLLRKAVSLTKAVVKHVASGAAVADETEVERRISICRGCEHFDATKTKCRKCGCGLALKSRWRTSTCPLNLWALPSENVTTETTKER